MADWKIARGGNTERTLTAAADPSPCDPYRQALTMRPSLKAPTFSFSPPAHKAGRGEAEAVGGAQPRRAGGRMSKIKEIKK